MPADQKASEERGAEDDLSVLTRIAKSSPRSARLSSMAILSGGQDARVVGNILREISVYSLKGKPESKGALKENQ